MTRQHTVRDDWLLPILKELVTPDVFTQFTHTTRNDYWKSAVVAGIATDIQILERAELHINVPPVDWSRPATDTAKYYIPEPIARRYTVAPIAISTTTLTVATANPYDLESEQALEFISRKRVEFQLASPTRIVEYLDSLYKTATHPSQLQELPGARYGEATTSRPIIQLVDEIVSDGINKRASDIHLESEENGISVRYRIDGVLQHIDTLPKTVGLPLVSRIKIMAHMDIADRLRPQGGRIRVMLKRQAIDLRVSTLPASHGEKVVIRILDPSASLRSLDALDLPPQIGGRLRKLLDIREGLLLITGPTGSGKTTTLYAALQQLVQRGLNIITVEDPVEYRVPGIVQVQVNEKAGLTFAAALRSILRQDPDVILIGEVRDKETAAIAIQAALTGHLVFATLHTIDACSSITRLHDLGVEPAKIAAALKGVIAQRLVRRLCTQCAHPSSEPIPPILWNHIPSGATLHSSTGCPTCSQTGFSGRIAVTELVSVTPDLERLIAAAAPTPTLSATARHGGSQSLWDTGISYVITGITSADEIIRVLDADHHEPIPDDIDHGTPNDHLDHDPYATDSDLSGIASTNPGTTASTTANTDDTADSNTFSPRPLSPVMTRVVIGVVDVYLVDPGRSPWQVLALQRAPHSVRPNSWETVHGKIDADEYPEQAAVREATEESGLRIDHLYNINVHAFYLHTNHTIQLALIFCGFVDSTSPVTLSEEHQRYEWLPITSAADRFTWPRARQALTEIQRLLSPETIDTVEDVLKVF